MRIGLAVIATAIMIATPIVVANVSFPTIPALAQSKAIPIKIQTFLDFESTQPLRMLKILSVVDSIEIQSITINRGNCVILNNLPSIMKYGDTRDFITVGFSGGTEVTACGEIIETVIKTNLGDFKFGN